MTRFFNFFKKLISICFFFQNMFFFCFFLMGLFWVISRYPSTYCRESDVLVYILPYWIWNIFSIVPTSKKRKIKGWFVWVKRVKPGMIRKTRGRVWEGGHTGQKTNKFSEILGYLGKFLEILGNIWTSEIFLKQIGRIISRLIFFCRISFGYICEFWKNTNIAKVNAVNIFNVDILYAWKKLKLHSFYSIKRC